jgi:hypothetical protein
VLQVSLGHPRFSSSPLSDYFHQSQNQSLIPYYGSSTNAAMVKYPQGLTNLPAVTTTPILWSFSSSPSPKLSSFSKSHHHFRRP